MATSIRAAASVTGNGTGNEVCVALQAISQATRYADALLHNHIIVGRMRQDYFSFARAGMV
jgi:DNA repair protein RadC